ncbi:MAG: type II secretion system minor pseudopilin GspK [Desulfurobacteriaceae bacterium]
MVAVIFSFLISIYSLSISSVSKSSEFRDYVKAYHAAVSAVKVALDYLKKRRDAFGFEPISYTYRGISVSLRITDECGRLNVNKLTNQLYYNVAKRLFENLKLNPSLASSIKDWIDRDDIPTDEGVESLYYETLGYKPSNKNMKSIYELLYVKGVDEKIFKQLEDYVTVYGDGKININSAPLEVLLALSEDMDEDAAKSILENRPIKNLEDLINLPGFSEELFFLIRPLITNRCNYFRIEASASYQDSLVSLVAFTTRDKILEWKVVQ